MHFLTIIRFSSERPARWLSTEAPAQTTGRLWRHTNGMSRTSPALKQNATLKYPSSKYLKGLIYAIQPQAEQFNAQRAADFQPNSSCNSCNKPMNSGHRPGTDERP